MYLHYSENKYIGGVMVSVRDQFSDDWGSSIENEIRSFIQRLNKFLVKITRITKSRFFLFFFT